MLAILPKQIVEAQTPQALRKATLPHSRLPLGMFTGRLSDAPHTVTLTSDSGKPITATRTGQTGSGTVQIEALNPDGTTIAKTTGKRGKLLTLRFIPPRTGNYRLQITAPGRPTTGSQPAWTRTANTGNNGSPEGLAKSTGIAASGMDFPTGAVGGHTPASSEYLATRWTAPQAGNVDISGSLWLWQNIGRNEEASLFVKGSSLFNGIAIPQPPTNTSSSPYTFSNAIVAGGGNATSLLSIPVQAGDTIILAVRRPDAEWFVGMNETIRLTPSAAPEAGSLALIATGLLPVLFRSRYRK